MRRWALVAFALAACDEAPVGPPPARPIERKSIDAGVAKPPPPLPEPTPIDAGPPKPTLAADAWVITFHEGGGYGSGTAWGRLEGNVTTATGWWYWEQRRGTVELRRGVLTAAARTQLWATLDEAKWEALTDVADYHEATDLGIEQLTIVRGDRTHTVTRQASWGKKTDPTSTAAAAVRRALDGLDAVKWTTQIRPLPKPNGASVQPGRCLSGLQCGPRDGRNPKQCFLGPRSGTVVCPLEPWDPTGILYTVDARSIELSRNPEPWGVILEGDVRCSREIGPDGYDRMLCDDRVAVDRLLEGGSRWLVLKNGVPALVKTIVFPRPWKAPKGR